MYLLTTVKSLKADIFDISPWSVVTLETSAFKLFMVANLRYQLRG